jgi:hypothetical protein
LINGFACNDSSAWAFEKVEPLTIGFCQPYFPAAEKAAEW